MLHIKVDERKYYYKDGTVSVGVHLNRILHRLCGPAIEYVSGTKVWFIDNKIHRIDGPAVEWHTGNKNWYIENERLTEEEFNQHPLVIEHKFQKALEEELLNE